MIVEYLKDFDGYEMHIEEVPTGFNITIKDSEIKGKSLSFLLKGNDLNFIINKLKSFQNG